MDDRSFGVLTVAFGDSRFVEMARVLALSIHYNWPGVPVAIATDEDVSDGDVFDSVVHLSPGASDLSVKLQLDRLSPFIRTVYLDSDCIVSREFEDVAAICHSHSFVAVGANWFSGEWFGTDVRAIRSLMGIEGPLPKFNSGFLYFDRSDSAATVFTLARSLWDRYEEIGLGRFRRSLPRADEPILAIAMAQAGVPAIDDPGTVMCTPIGMTGRVELDALGGGCRFVKNGAEVNPVIAHFCGYYRWGGVYRREARRLRSASKSGRWMSLRLFAWRLWFLPMVVFDHSTVWSLARSCSRAAFALWDSLSGPRSD